MVNADVLTALRRTAQIIVEFLKVALAVGLPIALILITVVFIAKMTPSQLTILAAVLSVVYPLVVVYSIFKAQLKEIRSNHENR